MKTITLKEAYAKATIPPLTINKYSHNMLMQGGVQVAVCGHHQTSVVREHNAALLAHAFNVLPEVVEALRGVIAIADRKTDEFDRARAALDKANTVKLP